MRINVFHCAVLLRRCKYKVIYHTNELVSISFPSCSNDKKRLKLKLILSNAFMVNSAKPHSLMQLYISCVIQIKAYRDTYIECVCLYSVCEYPLACAYFGLGDSTARVLRSIVEFKVSLICHLQMKWATF